jgi:FtsP/CotA-like multicopper oxidase with cupredoxin domain
MSASPHPRRRLALLAPLVLAAALLPAAALAQPAPPDRPLLAAAAAGGDPVDLCAKAGTVDLPGAPATPFWGFAQKPTPDTPCSDVSATLPGPTLEFTTGDAITITITNALPPGRTLSLTAPGIPFAAGPTDVAPGATASYSFTAPASGTYLYSSVGDAGRQQAMGLYGALLVCSATPCPTSGTHYGSPYDRAATLVLSELDTALNTSADPATYDLRRWAPRYWLINGKARPDTPDIPASAGQRVLLRYLSAGPETVTMTMLGMHGTLLARDAFKLDNPIDVVAETVPAGATADVIASVPAGTPSGTGLPLYNRQLRLNNGASGGPLFAPAAGGGMMTFVRVP